MNSITLIGRLHLPPVYHCTTEGQDLTRFELRTGEDHGSEVSAHESHHCSAWGPAAIDLHEHLNAGDRLLVRGELRYRSRKIRSGGVMRVPVVHVKGYSYLGR